jgi:tripartite ATP-independent transporter DctM subunit
MEIWAFVFFIMVILALLLGFPVAFTLGGLSLIFGLIFLEPEFFLLLPPRIMGVMNNYVLLAVPLFITMGLTLEKSGIAANLLKSMSGITGKYKGGLAISVVIVGTLLAASTGIVGATVVTMGLISLPVMLKAGYHPSFASGTIVASGTLGQIIPPSIILVLLGSVMNVSVGKLFSAAIIPGFLLVALYILYILYWFNLGGGRHTALAKNDSVGLNQIKVAQLLKEVRHLLLPLILIFIVLGSIFAGIASPTEAAALGAVGAIFLSVLEGKMTISVLKSVLNESMHITAMVFFILLGASTFSLVFRGMGGDQFLVEFIKVNEFNPNGFILFIMLLFFIIGFFIDFIEIIFILVPIVSPLLAIYGFDPIWIAILIAINLQTSFLTPPFGFALFYLKGIAPPEVTSAQIYRGAVPFVLIQLIVLILVFFFPEHLLLKW